MKTCVFTKPPKLLLQIIDGRPLLHCGQRQAL